MKNFIFKATEVAELMIQQNQLLSGKWNRFRIEDGKVIRVEKFGKYPDAFLEIFFTDEDMWTVRIMDGLDQLEFISHGNYVKGNAAFFEANGEKIACDKLQRVIDLMTPKPSRFAELIEALESGHNRYLEDENKLDFEDRIQYNDLFITTFGGIFLNAGRMMSIINNHGFSSYIQIREGDIICVVW